MTSQRDAQIHIERIRSELNPDGHPKLALLIKNALEIVANELYDSSTHFLLELLQNADDNKYTTNPTLKLTYKPGVLRVDSNETGFTRENVEAICAIRNSTKSGQNHSQGYTGEKGIGFKSVFKAADEVWISSREYRFKFDKRDEFGMIAPTWADFPDETSPNYTSIYLKLSGDYNAEELVLNLRRFNATSLLFLRTIRNIEIEVTQSKEETWRTALHRADTESSGNESIRSLHMGESKLEYITQRHLVGNLPIEARRPNYSHSELVLAFPVANFPTVPLSEPQNVYAFLPISDYGFKFSLQGDFLLTANRQLIDTSSPWNRMLRDALQEAFPRAVEDFNSKGGVMKYYWPFYVPGPEISPFFQPARVSILRTLEDSAVLESRAETMAKASQLVYVEPTKCADEKGQPFTSSALTATRYLSPEYPEWTIAPICSLGVRRLSDKEFLKDLKSMIARDPADFYDRSPQWHAQLARALIPLTAEPELLSDLKDLRIIPLSNGDWTSAWKKPAFFESTISSRFASLYNSPQLKPLEGPSLSVARKFNLDDFPATTDLLIVNRIALGDGTRRDLYEKLGVKNVSTSQICQHISDSHASPTFKPEQWTPEQLISHARFLYEASWRPSEAVDLWFATSNDRRCKGSSLYIPGSLSDSSENTATARVFRKLTTKYPTIHGDCMTDMDTDWILFLTTTLKLSKIPRLVTYAAGISKGPFSLSGEFKFLFRECSASDVLHVLNENWHTYGTWIESDAAQPQDDDFSLSRITLVNSIENTIVHTRNGPSRLYTTVFPLLDAYLEEHLSSLPVLDIDEPKDKVLRRRLSLFSVLVENNIDYYLYHLRQLKDQHSPPFEILSYVYEQIQLRYDTDEDIIENVFTEEDLIYVSDLSPESGQPIGWVSIDKCMTKNITVVSEYPRCEDLFRWLFANGCVEVYSLVAKAANINKSYKLRSIVRLFSEINEMLGKLTPNAAARAVKRLRDKAVFPIIKKGAKSFSGEFASPNQKSWFIADRSHLRQSFCGKVQLLAFTVQELNAMEHLSQAFLLDSRRLSKLALSKTAPKGPLRFSVSKTASIRNVAPFINALIPPPTPHRDVISRLMSSIEVSTAAEIIQTHVLNHNGINHIGHPIKAHVHSSLDGLNLRMFIDEEELASSHPSFYLVDLIAKHCNITSALHLQLLHTALSDTSIRRIKGIFESQGIHVDVAVKDDSSTTEYSVQSGNMFTIPSPFKVASNDSEVDGDYSGYLNRLDIVQNSNGKGRGKGSNRLLSDRRLKMMGVEHSELTPTPDLYLARNIDPNLTLEYLGQRLTSQLFEKYLGEAYQPIAHWTSALRSRAGLGCCDDFGEAASFTMLGQRISEAVTDFLVRNGHPEASQWRKSFPAYHFEIAPSAGDSRSPFPWRLSKLEKMRELQIPAAVGQKPKHVVILVRISDIYTQPRFNLFVNPWKLFISNRFILPGEAFFEAVIEQYDLSPSQRFVETSLEDNAASGKPSGANNPVTSSQNLMPTMPAPVVLNQQRLISVTPGVYNQGAAPLSFYSGYATSCGSGITQAFWPVSYYPVPCYCSFPSVYEQRPMETHWQGPGTAVYPQYDGKTLDSILVDTDAPQQGIAEATDSRGRNTYASKGLEDLSDNVSSTSMITRQSYEQQESLNHWVSLECASKYGRTPYTYRSLKDGQIRLFTLFSGEERDQMRGTLCEYTLTDADPYRTLSYTWGPADQQMHTIITPEGTLSIRESLNAALLTLRSKENAVILWIDAICINQADSSEKAKQIRLLPEIFQQATCTVALLGSDKNSDAAIEMLMQVRAKQVYGAGSEDWPKKLPRIPSSWEGEKMPPPEDPIWRLVAALFNREWFRRAWIVQEAIAAPTVNIVCGKWMIDWNDLFFAIEIVDRELWQTPCIESGSWQPFRTLAKHREWEARQCRWSLFLLLETFRHVHSLHRRDRFFSLLGLANDGHLAEFGPDYERPFEDIVCRFARAFITQGKGIEMLSRAGLSSQPNRFPSWIPDWTTTRPPSLSESLERGVVYDASKGTVADIKLVPDLDDEIAVKSIFVDKIMSVSQSFNQPDKLKKLADYFKEIDYMIDEFLNEFYTPSQRDELKWLVPIAGATHPTVATTGNVDVYKSYKALRKICTKSTKSGFKGAKDRTYLEGDMTDVVTMSPANEGMSVREKSLTYLSLLKNTIQGWRFIVTERGLCGIAPYNVIIEDLVGVCAGGSVPILVRVSSERTGAFRLIGECYVHGIMKGEMVVSEDAIQDTLRLH